MQMGFGELAGVQVGRKQASFHVPEGKGRQDSKKKEVLRKSAGH